MTSLQLALTQQAATGWHRGMCACMGASIRLRKRSKGPTNPARAAPAAGTPAAGSSTRYRHGSSRAVDGNAHRPGLPRPMAHAKEGVHNAHHPMVTRNPLDSSDASIALGICQGLGSARFNVTQSVIGVCAPSAHAGASTGGATNASSLAPALTFSAAVRERRDGCNTGPRACMHAHNSSPCKRTLATGTRSW